MINWIIGGVIIGLTLLIVIRSIGRMRRGESSCCEGCSQSKNRSQCSCSNAENIK